MEARPDLGETPGGLQAPHVIRKDGICWMFHGDRARLLPSPEWRILAGYIPVLRVPGSFRQSLPSPSGGTDD